MDLRNLAVSQEMFDLVLRHPVTFEEIANEDGTPCTIGIFSSDTPKVKKALAKAKRLAAETKGEVTDEHKDRLMAEALAECTGSCNMVMGEKVEHSVEAMADIFNDPDFQWIKQQVLAGVDDRSNFIES